MGPMIGRIATFVIFLAAFALAGLPASARTSVSGLRLGAHPDGITRLAMDISDAMNFRVRLLTGPNRIVVETDGIAWQTEPALKKTVGAVSALSYGEGRLVLTLAIPAEVKSAFVISPRDGLGWRFVMDLKETSRDRFVSLASPAPKQAVAVSAAPRATAGKSIVVMSPAAEPAPPPPPPPLPPAQIPPGQVPTGQVEAPPEASARLASLTAGAAAGAEPDRPVPQPRPAESRAATKLAGPMLSAPMPPPPEPPQAFAALAGLPAPPPSDALPMTKVAMPVPAPDPEPPRPTKSGDGKPVIVIDPGHGGVDPGATGVSGIYEKHITLAMARELKEQLERGGHFHVHLTRDHDIFIRLRDRVQVARQVGADLFISLHADVVKDPQIRGLSIYTLSQNASDAEAQALADNENKADLIAGIDLSHETADVANILIDLAQRETMNRSAAFAGDIVDQLGHDHSLLANTHRFAGFAVLKAPDVPSVLIEMGYLSNDSEERNLRQPEYRAKLSRAIAQAVEHYFPQRPKGKRP